MTLSLCSSSRDLRWILRILLTEIVAAETWRGRSSLNGLQRQFGHHPSYTALEGYFGHLILQYSLLERDPRGHITVATTRQQLLRCITSLATLYI